MMPNMNLNANFDRKQIGLAGAVWRLMIKKKKKTSIFHHFSWTLKTISMKNVHTLPKKSSVTAPIEFPILKLQYRRHIGW